MTTNPPRIAKGETMTTQSIDYESPAEVTYTAYGSPDSDGRFNIKRAEVRDSIYNIWPDIEDSLLAFDIQDHCDRVIAKQIEDEALLRSQCKSDEDYQSL